jgi:predicted house-cleaning noncanonical NTP pyrophosphatase (MazG superfamily)
MTEPEKVMLEKINDMFEAKNFESLADALVFLAGIRFAAKGFTENSHILELARADVLSVVLLIGNTALKCEQEGGE